jgi:hypothetical protein
MERVLILSMDGGELLFHTRFQSVNVPHDIPADVDVEENDSILRLQQSAKLYTIYHLMKQDLTVNSNGESINEGIDGVGEKQCGGLVRNKNMDYWIQMNETQTCFWECVSPNAARPSVLIIMITDISISREIVTVFLQDLSSVYENQVAVHKEENMDGKNNAIEGALSVFYEYVAQAMGKCECAKKRVSNKLKSKQLQDRESQMVMSAIIKIE